MENNCKNSVWLCKSVTSDLTPPVMSADDWSSESTPVESVGNCLFEAHS